MKKEVLPEDAKLPFYDMNKRCGYL